MVMAEHFFNRRLVLKLDRETPEHIIVSKMKAPELIALDAALNNPLLQ